MAYEIMFIGLLVSLLFINVTGYYPGGIIVPSYLILFVDQPIRLFGTLIAALLTLAAYKLISKYLILFGKRRFVFMILGGAVFAYFMSFVLPSIFPFAIELKVIGWVIPGLIANNFDRQGIISTSSSMAIVVTALFFINQLFYSLI